MQIARTGYLAAYSLIPDATKFGSDGDISSRREYFQRRDLRRIGLITNDIRAGSRFYSEWW